MRLSPQLQPILYNTKFNSSAILPSTLLALLALMRSSQSVHKLMILRTILLNLDLSSPSHTYCTSHALNLPIPTRPPHPSPLIPQTEPTRTIGPIHTVLAAREHHTTTYQGARNNLPVSLSALLCRISTFAHIPTYP